MNAKEKASELIVNYQLQCKSLDYQEAKQCALIAVDAMMEIYVTALYTIGIEKHIAELTHNPYLQQLKQEIEKL